MPQGRGSSKSGSKKQQQEEPAEEQVEVPQQIPIQKEVVQHSQATTCVTEGPGLRLSVVVIESGQPVQYTWLIGAAGKEAIKECVNETGIITDVSMSDIEAAKGKE